MVVGFQDKLKMCNVFASSIRAYREITIKACKEVQFSHGGQWFAAANPTQQQRIDIYNTYTGENPSALCLRGHNGKVKSIHWSQDDRSIVSADVAGHIYKWSLFEKNKDKKENKSDKQEHISKGTI